MKSIIIKVFQQVLFFCWFSWTLVTTLGCAFLFGGARSKNNWYCILKKFILQKEIRNNENNQKNYVETDIAYPNLFFQKLYKLVYMSDQKFLWKYILQKNFEVQVWQYNSLVQDLGVFPQFSTAQVVWYRLL